MIDSNSSLQCFLIVKKSFDKTKILFKFLRKVF
jgi:hypothetical protein